MCAIQKRFQIARCAHRTPAHTPCSPTSPRSVGESWPAVFSSCAGPNMPFRSFVRSSKGFFFASSWHCPAKTRTSCATAPWMETRWLGGWPYRLAGASNIVSQSASTPIRKFFLADILTLAVRRVLAVPLLFLLFSSVLSKCPQPVYGSVTHTCGHGGYSGCIRPRAPRSPACGTLFELSATHAH